MRLMLEISPRESKVTPSQGVGDLDLDEHAVHAPVQVLLFTVGLTMRSNRSPPERICAATSAFSDSLRAVIASSHPLRLAVAASSLVLTSP